MSIKKLQRPVDSVFANFSKGSAKFMDLELSDSEIQELQQKGLSVEVLDKFDKGGNVFPYKSPLKPYVPKSVEDHLYRKGMYADSLSLYNAHVFQKNSWKPGSEEFLTKHGGSKEDIKKLRAQRSSMIATHGRNFIGFNYATYNSKNLASPGQSYPVMPSEQVIVDKYKELIKHNPSSFKIGYYSSPDLWHKSIKPIGTYIDGDFSPIYKKPVQEIADVNTGDSLPVKSVLNFPRSYPELAVSNFDGVKKSLPTPYSMSGRQQTVLTWNPELKRHDETVRVQDDAFIKDKEEWEDNSQPVVYYNPETKEYNDKPFVFNYEGRNQTYNFKTGGPLNPSTEEDGTAYTYNNKNYKKDGNGKWSVDVNGTYMPLVEGDVAARSNLLNKQAQPVQMYGKPKMPSTTREYPLPTIVGDNTKTVLPKQAVNQINNSMYMSSPEYIAEQKAKEKQLADFKKSKWEKYEKGTFSDKALDRVQSAMVDPLGMASRFMSGEQAYIPGMGKGLLNHDSPEYSDYLKAVGYTPGKFEVSDVQNILNPMNWGASAGNQLNKGNYAAGTAEALLAFTGVGGVGKNALSGAKLLGRDLKVAKQELIYRAIDPVGYGVKKKIIQAPRSLYQNTLYPSKRPEKIGRLLDGYIDTQKTTGELQRIGKNRLDSFRTGLGVEQKYDTFEKIGNKYRIKDFKMAEEEKQFYLHDIMSYEAENSLSGSDLTKKLKEINRSYDLNTGFNREYLEGSNGLSSLINKKAGDFSPWKRTRVVEKAKDSNYEYSIYSADNNGVMGGYRMDVRRNLDGVWEFKTADTWDLQPLKKASSINKNHMTEPNKFKHKFANLEFLKLLGGKPFEIENKFSSKVFNLEEPVENMLKNKGPSFYETSNLNNLDYNFKKLPTNFTNKQFGIDETGLPRLSTIDADGNFPSGMVGTQKGIRKDLAWPYIGMKGEKVLNSIRTTYIPKGKQNPITVRTPQSNSVFRFKHGGDVSEEELTDEEIKKYRSLGYKVEIIN